MRRFLGIVLLSLLAVPADPENTHQRLSATKDVRHVLSPSVGVSISPTRLDETYQQTAVTANFSIEYLYRDEIHAAIAIPAHCFVTFGHNQQMVFRDGLGDPSALVGCLLRADDSRMRLQIGYSYPLGVWNPYEIMERRIQTGSGYHTLMFLLSCSRIVDPVVENITLEYSIGMPRRERFGWSMLPGNVAISFVHTEALNSEIGISYAANCSIILPVVHSGHINGTDIRYNLTVGIGILWHKEKASVSASVKRSLLDVIAMPTANMTGRYDLEM